MIEMALAGFLLLHGIAHLVGFLIPWRLMQSEEAPYKTTVLSGALDVGAVGIRIVGIVWLLLALGFAAAAFGIGSGAPWGSWWLTVVTSVSLVACLGSLPEAKVGVVVNALLLAFLALAPGLLGGPESDDGAGSADAILDGAQRAVMLWPTPGSLAILADAAVEGPAGAFRALVHSSSDGRVRMEQTPQGFLAGLGRTGGWRVDPQSGRVEDLGEGLYFVRGHELHMLALLPRSRLTDPRVLEEGSGESGDLLAVAMSLPTGDSVVAYFEREDTLPAGLRITYTDPHVVVTWSDWAEIRGVRVFLRATFRQGDEAFHYTFDRVDPGPLPDSVFEPPSAVPGGPGGS
jgi:hypothetical protein